MRRHGEHRPWCLEPPCAPLRTGHRGGRPLAIADDLALRDDVHPLPRGSVGPCCHSQRRVYSWARSSSPAPRSDSRQRRLVADPAIRRLAQPRAPPAAKPAAPTLRRRRRRRPRRPRRGKGCESRPSCGAAATTPATSPTGRADRCRVGVRVLKCRRRRRVPHLRGSLTCTPAAMRVCAMTSCKVRGLSASRPTAVAVRRMSSATSWRSVT